MQETINILQKNIDKLDRQINNKRRLMKVVDLYDQHELQNEINRLEWYKSSYQKGIQEMPTRFAESEKKSLDECNEIDHDDDSELDRQDYRYSDYEPR